MFVSAAGVHVSISGERLHCFLAGVQIKSYVIATSDLWLFIHASNLLPLLPTPLPYTKYDITDAYLHYSQSQLPFFSSLTVSYTTASPSSLSFHALTANEPAYVSAHSDWMHCCNTNSVLHIDDLTHCCNSNSVLHIDDLTHCCNTNS